MEFFDKTELEFSAKESARLRFRRKIGEFINKFAAPAREYARLEHQAYVLRARSPGPVMPPHEVAKHAEFMNDMQQLDARRAHFANTLIENTFQGQIIPLVKEVVSQNNDVKRVVNIGAHYGYSDHQLACEFENVDFLSVDFAKNLAEFNAEFERPNLTFRSGYAMEMIKKGELDADVYLFSSTAVVIQNHELLEYFKEIASRGKFIVLSEPIYKAPDDAILDPLTLRADESKPVYQYQMFEGDYGPLCFVHPYRQMLEAAGFEIMHYNAFKPKFTDLRLVHVVAKVK